MTVPFVAGVGAAGFALTGSYNTFGTPVLPFTVTCPMPAGTNLGDLLIAPITVCLVGGRGVGGAALHAVDTPAGWNLYALFNNGGGQIICVFTRIVDGTEGPSQVFQYSLPTSSTAGFMMNGAIIAARHPMFEPILHTSSFQGVTSDGHLSITGPVTTVNDALLLIEMEPAGTSGNGLVTPADVTGATPLLRQQSTPPIADTLLLWSSNFPGHGQTPTFTSPTGWPHDTCLALVLAVVPSTTVIPVPPPTPPVVTIKGELVGLTYDPPEVEDGQNVYAWHQHPLGASLANDNSVLSIAVIPAPDGSRDELWMEVQRTINGRQVTYVEYMEKAFETGDAQASACFEDCSSQYSGPAATTIFPLDHLEDETVRVLADGAAHPDCVVTDGVITLQAPASVVQVGLKTAYDLVTLKVEAGSQLGTAQAKLKRISKLNGIRLLNALGGKFGQYGGGVLDPIEYRDTTDVMDSPPQLFTGDKTNLSYEGGWERSGRIEITDDGPFPMTVVALFPELDTTDG